MEVFIVELALFMIFVVTCLSVGLVVIILFDKYFRKKLLILDMNNVLVCRVFKFKQTEDSIPFTKSAIVLGGKFYTWKRPHLNAFLDHCFKHYTVAVWSSAQGQNVSDLVDFVFGEERKRELLFVWDQTKCETIETGKEKPLFKKPLSRVWAEYPKYNSSNTFIMDDSKDKMLGNPENTWMQVKPWIVSDTEDVELLKIINE